MKPHLHPEVADFRGFSWVLGWVEGKPCDRIRVLGVNADATQVRIEWIDRGEKPREWWPIDRPIFAGLAKHVRASPPRPTGNVEQKQPEQVGLFAGVRVTL